MRSLALSFVFGGQPLGAIVSGILIRQFKFFKILLVANTAASAILYAMLAAAWFSEHDRISTDLQYLTDSFRARDAGTLRPFGHAWIPHGRLRELLARGAFFNGTEKR